MNTTRIHMNMKPLIALVAFALFAVAPLAAEGPAMAPVQFSAGKIVTARATIEPDITGLPKQIDIHVAPNEGPLELRGKAVPADVLKWMGRGPQLRSPIRIEATIAGEKTPLKAGAADIAKPELKDGAVACSAKLSAGTLAATLATRYEPDGAILCTLTYSGTGDIDSLDLVAELEGLVDCVVLGDALAAAPQAYAAKDFNVANEEGVVWGNGAKDAAHAGKAAPGPVKQAYVGSGDRGFTFLCDDTTGWSAAGEASTLAVERDKAGAFTWRTRFVNAKTTLGAAKTINFAILVHPAATPAADRLAKAWMNWPDAAAKTAAVSLKTRGELLAKPDAAARADLAAAIEAAAPLCSLQGPAADMLDANHDSAATFPTKLFRYLAATHTGLTARVKSNAAALVPAGASKGADRVLLGRALVHNIGLDAAGVSHLAEAARVVGILQKTGLLDADGKTEFIPYWRGSALLRYGEAFTGTDDFETTEHNPVGAVYTSVYRRLTDKAAGAVIVIVNEGDKPVREQLYIFDPARVFGGANIMTEATAMAKLDFAKIPPDSDWRASFIGGRPRNDQGGPQALLDLEDNGAVRQLPNLKASPDVYGPLYVGAHDFRIIYGCSR